MGCNCGPECLLCYANVRGRSNYRGHRGYRDCAPKRRYFMGKYAKKRQAVRKDHGDGLGVRLCPLVDRFPALWEYLTETADEEGKARQTATLLITLDGDRLKAWFNDRDNSRSAWVSGSTLTGVLESLEEGLKGDELDWRFTPPKGGDRKRK